MKRNLVATWMQTSKEIYGEEIIDTSMIKAGWSAHNCLKCKYDTLQ